MSTKKGNEGGPPVCLGGDHVAKSVNPSSPLPKEIFTSPTPATQMPASSQLTPRTFGPGSPFFGSPEADGVSKESAVSEGLMFLDHDVHEKPLRNGTYTVWVDEKEGVMPDDFIEKISQKCFTLHVQRKNMEQFQRFGIEVSQAEAGGFCQAVLVKGRDGVRRFVTNKHTVKQKALEGPNKNTVLHNVRLITLFSINANMMVEGFPDMVRFPADEDRNYEDESAHGVLLRDGAYWKYGTDIAWGTAATIEDFTTQERLAGFESTCLPSAGDGHFSMVDRDDFRIKEGQKVGIVVYNRYTVTRAHKAFKKSTYAADTTITDEKLLAQYGPAHSIAIYCGEITYVGKDHIEYGLNSYNGCSAAAVFLLDVPDQHPSVQQDDRGKIIASHAGYHPKLGTNIGFPIDPQQLKKKD